MTTVQKCEKFYELLATKHHPRLGPGLKIKLNTRSRYIFKARKNGSGVKAEVGFIPGSHNWETHLLELCRAALDIIDGRTEAVGLNKQNEVMVSLRKYEVDMTQVKAGHYLPKGATNAEA